ncbi:23S rRNA (adenine(2030)-N(6))-methyltransferase RlmJ [Amaricoccus tamworthensis]|uniref:23S rRNA (adenine(2030)-N(6))-methyltransferase RlmJ n=1 Tax=Amaricoccus tamworthensis TaxID=57002 RepID=UPI003C7C8BBE
MLSYQHAYHAAGPADLHKHIALAEMLTLLTAKKRGISYVETHAGRGLYDLAGAESAKTGEAETGLGRFGDAHDGAFGFALEQTRANYGPDAYPGSPLVAANLLRDVDRITFMELHPGEHQHLKRAMSGHAAAVHRRDGLEGVLALAPFQPRRGLVLVDPSYEVKTEYAAIAEFTLKLIRKWPETAIMIWYPLLKAARHGEMLSKVRARLPVMVDEVTFRQPPERGMFGSGLALVNAPYGAGSVFSKTHRMAAAVLVPQSGK